MKTRRGALLPALLLAACTAAGDGSERLALSARSWILAGEDAGIAVRTTGPLAGRSARLTVAANDAVVDGDWMLKQGAGTLRIPAARLSPGVNRILVKTGSERSAIAIRVVPMGGVVAAAAAIAIVAALLVARALRAAPPAGG
jgi:hypothetical protein